MTQAVNPHSADWALLKRWNTERIAEWRIELEGLNCAPDRANQLRGMIYALTAQQAHIEPPTPVKFKEPNYG